MSDSTRAHTVLNKVDADLRWFHRMANPRSGRGSTRRPTIRILELRHGLDLMIVIALSSQYGTITPPLIPRWLDS